MNRSSFRLAHYLGFVLGISLIAGAATACDDDDEPSDEDVQAIENTIRTVAEAVPGEAEAVFAAATDNLLATVYFATKDECRANAEECIGEPSVVESISEVDVDGDRATATVARDFGTFNVGLIREGDRWLMDSLEAASDELPEGADAVDLELVDFAFRFDPEDIPSDGNFAFRIQNTGEQSHEVVLIAVPSGASVEEAVEAVAAEEVPPLGLKVYIRPGQEDLNMAFEAPLEPGNYALVCFFPDTTDPEFAAHVEKGMLAEFAIE